MRVNRKFLYMGVFLVAIGSVAVVADVAATDGTAIRDALRLWPLAIVAIGLGIALRRTEFAVPAGLVAAMAPGLLIGGGFALAPGAVADCGDGGPPSTITTEEGLFDAPARVSISTGCGTLAVNTAPGSAWRLDRSDATVTPIVDASAGSLSIDAGGRRWWQRMDEDRDDWILTLPTSPIEDLIVVVNAGEGQLALPQAQIERMSLTTNAASAEVDLSEARIKSLAGTVNAGQLSYWLPAGNLTGTFEVNAGGLAICAPGNVGLQVAQESNLAGISINGQHETASNWQSADYASAPFKADLTISVNFGNVEINPIGGCK